MRGRRLLVATLSAAMATCASAGGVAFAEPLEKVEKKLGQFDGEVGQLVLGVRRPSELIGPRSSADIAVRRTIDAQVNFGIGNYAEAAIVLYDVVERFPNHKVYDDALYYLAESLYKKGDAFAARSHFTKLVKERGSSNRFYVASLERLIELALDTDDMTGVEEWLALLDAVPAAEQRSSVPYVRGKYAFYLQQFDDALVQFAKIDKKSPYYFQARYFLAAAHIGKSDLAKADAELTKLVEMKPANDDQTKVIELSYIALGRIHYERNQPSQAIDRYLEVDRKSALFDDTMFEAAWVYVKNKDFNNALGALERLALSDPMSTRLPEVKILEGNLRIRKAQKLAEAEELTKKESTSQAEYDRAVYTFGQVKEIFGEPRAQLQLVLAEQRNPSDYLAQVTGRHAEVFDIKATLPEVAAAWLRQEPEVKRVVAVEGDLGQIQDDVDTAEATIFRLEQALSTSSRVGIFPELSDKRIKAIEIQDQLIAIRIDLANQLHGKVSGTAETARLRSERTALEREFKALPDASVSESERITRAVGRAAKIESDAQAVAATIGEAESKLVAMEKFINDDGFKESTPGQRDKVSADLEAARAEIEAMRSELALIQSDAQLAKDRAGTGDDNAIARHDLRARLRLALDAEDRALQRAIASTSGDARTEANRIAGLSRRSSGISTRLDAATNKIDTIVEESLIEVRSILAEEKARLFTYKAEYAAYDQETHTLGGEVLAQAFVSVSNKFYDILMRADVGMVDVAWSVKEGADESLRRLTLDQAREARTLDADFADVVREVRAQRESELLRQQNATGDSGENAGADDANADDANADDAETGSGGAP